MSIVLHGLESFAMAYLDDIIIFNTSEDHKQHIQKYFDCLRPHNLNYNCPNVELHAGKNTVSGLHN